MAQEALLKLLQQAPNERGLMCRQVRDDWSYQGAI